MEEGSAAKKGRTPFSLSNPLNIKILKNMEIEYLTQAGLDSLKKELADALAQRPVISAAIAEAR